MVRVGGQCGHREMLGEHGLWGKSIYHEESIMIPMLIAGPEIAEGHHRVTAPNPYRTSIPLPPPWRV